MRLVVEAFSGKIAMCVLRASLVIYVSTLYLKLYICIWSQGTLE